VTIGEESPNVHSNPTREPSGSEDVEPLNTIVSTANGASGENAKAATGGALTIRTREVEPVKDASSRTVSVTVYALESGYVWTVVMSAPVVPSPKWVRGLRRVERHFGAR